MEARRAPFVPSHPTRCQQTGQKTGGVGAALSSFSHPPSNSGSRDDETSPGRVRRDFMWDCSCFGKSCAAPFSQERVLDCRWVVAVLLPGRASACQTLPGQTTALRRLPVVWMDLVRGSLRWRTRDCFKRLLKACKKPLWFITRRRKQLVSVWNGEKKKKKFAFC